MTDQSSEATPGSSPAYGDRYAQIFPKLSAEQLELLFRYGERRAVPADTVLFQQGQRHISIYVILSGQIEISRGTALGARVIGVHGPGMFTGEVGTLAGRAAIATGRTVVDSELIEIDENNLRNLVVLAADLSETIMRAYILRRVAFINDEHGGVILIGSRNNAETLTLREFLMRNAHPVAYFDVNEHAETADLMRRFEIATGDIPALVSVDGQVLKRPTTRALADAIGLSPDNLDGACFDLVVVGAGPGGLAAAVYAASEGLKVAVLDAKAPGGQAGSSSKIENYFGFPTGISGRALAGRGLSQARKFGAEVAVPVEVINLVCNAPSDGYRMELNSGEKISARTVIVATGARYRRPALDSLGGYEGRGVYYAASFMEATFCANEEIIIVGGGNSAGQAAVFLAGYAKKVHILVRSSGLGASMSHYLIQRIEAAENIELHCNTQVVELAGEEKLERVRCKKQGEDVEELDVRHLFLFLGAEPNTGWLGDCLALDNHGFILTGQHVPKAEWHMEREPHFLETSRPGIFAVGDVRSGSVKRVAAAVGEGAAAVQALHQVLAGDDFIASK